MDTITEITGRAAIDLARQGFPGLRKYGDPTEGDRPLTVDEACEVAGADPSLVYIEVPGRSLGNLEDVLAHVEGLLGPEGSRALAAHMVDQLEGAGMIIREFRRYALREVPADQWDALLVEALAEQEATA